MNGFYENEYDKWNRIKQKVNAENPSLNRFPKIGEVWISTVGKNIGFEQNGTGKNFSRPLLIIYKFNNHMFWAIPLSSKQKRYDFYHNYIDPNSNSVAAIISQLKLVSIKRFRRKIYTLPNQDLIIIKQKLKNYLK
jgi:mRNA interferase MazF